jgi:hypothetical protein
MVARLIRRPSSRMDPCRFKKGNGFLKCSDQRRARPHPEAQRRGRGQEKPSACRVVRSSAEKEVACGRRAERGLVVGQGPDSHTLPRVQSIGASRRGGLGGAPYDTAWGKEDRTELQVRGVLQASGSLLASRAVVMVVVTRERSRSRARFGDDIANQVIEALDARRHQGP